MSRIGLSPITIEDGVTVERSGDVLNISGPLGTSSVTIPDFLDLKVDGSEITINLMNPDSTDKTHKSMHGTIRSLVYNSLHGVKHGYSKKLEIVGVGYRVKSEGNGITLTLGWTHPVKVDTPEGIQFEVPDETTLIVKGIDKQYVGEVAAKIRELRKPEPYKGKGVRYEGEYVRKKSPKVAVAAK